MKKSARVSEKLVSLGLPSLQVAMRLLGVYFNDTLERLDVFLDKGVQFKVLPNLWLNLTRFPTAGSWLICCQNEGITNYKVRSKIVSTYL